MQNHAQSVNSQQLTDTSNASSTLEVRYVDNKILDVFRGNGWENWSRFEKRGNHYKLIAGEPLSTQEYNELP
jgi:hypothetical protein